MSILNTKAGDHPHVQVLFPFRMSRKRAWKPKRSLGGPVAHAALSWWPRDRNPARVWAPRTARSCWERVGKKNLGGKSSPPASACPLPGPRMPRRASLGQGPPRGEHFPSLSNLKERLHPAESSPQPWERRDRVGLEPLAASSGVFWGSSALCSGTGRTETPLTPRGAAGQGPGVASPGCHPDCRLRRSPASASPGAQQGGLN